MKHQGKLYQRRRTGGNINRKNGGQLFDYINYLGKRGSNNNLILVTTADISDIRKLINYGDDIGVNVFHIVAFYKKVGNQIHFNFEQALYINSIFGGEYFGYSKTDLLVKPFIRQNYGKSKFITGQIIILC